MGPETCEFQTALKSTALALNHHILEHLASDALAAAVAFPLSKPTVISAKPEEELMHF